MWAPSSCCSVYVCVRVSVGWRILNMAEGGLSLNRSQESIDERSAGDHDSTIQVSYGCVCVCVCFFDHYTKFICSFASFFKTN